MASGGDLSHLGSGSRSASGEGCALTFWPIILEVVKAEVNFDYYTIGFYFFLNKDKDEVFIF